MSDRDVLQRGLNSKECEQLLRALLKSTEFGHEIFDLDASAKRVAKKVACHLGEEATRESQMNFWELQRHRSLLFAENSELIFRRSRELFSEVSNTQFSRGTGDPLNPGDCDSFGEALEKILAVMGQENSGIENARCYVCQHSEFGTRDVVLKSYVCEGHEESLAQKFSQGFLRKFASENPLDCHDSFWCLNLGLPVVVFIDDSLDGELEFHWETEGLPVIRVGEDRCTKVFPRHRRKVFVDFPLLMKSGTRLGKVSCDIKSHCNTSISGNAFELAKTPSFVREMLKWHNELLRHSVLLRAELEISLSDKESCDEKLLIAPEKTAEWCGDCESPLDFARNFLTHVAQQLDANYIAFYEHSVDDLDDRCLVLRWELRDRICEGNHHVIDETVDSVLWDAAERELGIYLQSLQDESDLEIELLQEGVSRASLNSLPIMDTLASVLVVPIIRNSEGSARERCLGVAVVGRQRIESGAFSEKERSWLQSALAMVFAPRFDRLAEKLCTDSRSTAVKNWLQIRGSRSKVSIDDTPERIWRAIDTALPSPKGFAVNVHTSDLDQSLWHFPSTGTFSSQGIQKKLRAVGNKLRDLTKQFPDTLHYHNCLQLLPEGNDSNGGHYAALGCVVQLAEKPLGTIFIVVPASGVACKAYLSVLRDLGSLLVSDFATFAHRESNKNKQIKANEIGNLTKEILENQQGPKRAVANSQNQHKIARDWISTLRHFDFEASWRTEELKQSNWVNVINRTQEYFYRNYPSCIYASVQPFSRHSQGMLSSTRMFEERFTAVMFLAYSFLGRRWMHISNTWEIKPKATGLRRNELIIRLVGNGGRQHGPQSSEASINQQLRTDIELDTLRRMVAGYQISGHLQGGEFRNWRQKYLEFYFPLLDHVVNEKPQLVLPENDMLDTSQACICNDRTNESWPSLCPYCARKEVLALEEEKQYCEKVGDPLPCGWGGGYGE